MCVDSLHDLIVRHVQPCYTIDPGSDYPESFDKSRLILTKKWKERKYFTYFHLLAVFSENNRKK